MDVKGKQDVGIYSIQFEGVLLQSALLFSVRWKHCLAGCIELTR